MTTNMELDGNQNNPEVVVNTLVKGYVEVNCAGGSNITLSDPEESRYAQIECSGVLTANIDVIVPAESKIYVIRNTTTGSFTLTVKVAGQTGVVVTQGSAFHLGCDGVDTYRIS